MKKRARDSRDENSIKVIIKQEGERRVNSSFCRQLKEAGPAASPAAMSSSRNVPKKKGKRNFTNGHKCFTSAEANFLTEILDRESGSRVVFHAKLPTLKKARDPTIGELTSRENAEYVMPFTDAYKRTLESRINSANTATQPVSAGSTEKPLMVTENGKNKFNNLIIDIAQIESLKQKKNDINDELAQLQKILDHKKSILNLTKF